MNTFELDNDHFLTVSALTDTADASLISAATVSVTVVDSDGAEVTGATWPLTVPAVEGAPGTYRVVLPDTLGLTAGRQYRARLTADDGDGRRWSRVLLFWAKEAVV